MIRHITDDLIFSTNDSDEDQNWVCFIKSKFVCKKSFLKQKTQGIIYQTRDVFFKRYVYNTLKYNKLYLKFLLDKVVFKLNPLLSVLNKNPCTLEQTCSF